MSSKRRLRRRSCDGKVGHADFQSAFLAQKRMNEDGLHPYKCQFCKKYHIGHKTKIQKQMAYKKQMGC